MLKLVFQVLRLGAIIGWGVGCHCSSMKLVEGMLNIISMLNLGM